MRMRRRRMRRKPVRGTGKWWRVALHFVNDHLALVSPEVGDFSQKESPNNGWHDLLNHGILLASLSFASHKHTRCCENQIIPDHIILSPCFLLLYPFPKKTTHTNCFQVPAAGWTQWILFLGLIEKGIYTYDPTRAPGDYKNAGVLGVPNGSTMTPGWTDGGFL